MQFLLTEEEYRELLHKSDSERKEFAINALLGIIWRHLGIECPLRDDIKQRTTEYPCYYCPIHNEVPRNVSREFCHPEDRMLPK